MRLHCDVVLWLITMKWSRWLHSVGSKYPIRSPPNEHSDFSVESPNGNHSRILLETNEMHHIFVQYNDCDTCDHSRRLKDVTLTGYTVKIAHFYYIWRLYSCLSSNNILLLSSINFLLDFCTLFVFTSLNKIAAISSNLC